MILPMVTLANTITLNETNGGNVGDSKVISGTNATGNFGSNTSLDVGLDGGIKYRTFLLFNLPVIQNHSTSIINITNANLSLDAYVLSGGFIYAYNTSSDWVENTITWDNQPSSDILQDTKQMDGSPTIWKYFNITNASITAYADNRNVSIVLIDTAESGIGYYNKFLSKEYQNLLARPQLIIDYTCTATLMTCGGLSPCVNYTQYRNCTDDCDVASMQNNTCYSGNTSTNYCYDNNTLITSNIYIFNGEEYSFLNPENCNYGCDNITMTCKPEKYIVDLYAIGIIVLIIFISIIIIIKVKK